MLAVVVGFLSMQVGGGSSVLIGSLKSTTHFGRGFLHEPFWSSVSFLTYLFLASVIGNNYKS